MMDGPVALMFGGVIGVMVACGIVAGLITLSDYLSDRRYRDTRKPPLPRRGKRF